MAKKRLNVEDLNLSSGITPNITPVDTFAAPVAPDYQDIKRNSLSTFLNQLTPEVTNFTRKELQLKAKLDAQKAMEFDFQSNGLINYAEAREKGLLDVRSDPTVKLAYNEALGRSAAKEIRDEIQNNFNENFESYKKLSPKAFSNWYTGMVAQGMEARQDVLEGVGSKGELRRILDSHANQMRNTHNQANFKYVQEQLEVNFYGSLESTLEGVDLTDSKAISDALNVHNDDKFKNHSSYTGTNINQFTAAYLSNLIKFSRNPIEVKAIAEAVPNIKAGSGTLENTNYWKFQAREIETQAYEKLDSLNTKIYQKEARNRAIDSRNLTEKFVDAYNNGQDISELEIDGAEFSSLNDAEILEIRNTAVRRVSIERPMTMERRVLLNETLEDYSLVELDDFITDVATGKIKEIGGLEITMSDLEVLKSTASWRKSSNSSNIYSDLNFKEMNNMLKNDFNVSEGLDGAFAFAKPKLEQDFRDAQTILQTKFIAAMQDKALLQQYFTDGKFEEYRNLPLTDLKNIPNVLRHIRENMYNSVIDELGGFPPESRGYLKQKGSNVTGTVNSTSNNNSSGVIDLSLNPKSSATKVTVTPID